MDLSGQILKSEAQVLKWRSRLSEIWPLRRGGTQLKPLSVCRAWLVRGADNALDRAVRRLDGFLRRCQHIIEFTTDEQCILRVSLGRAQRTMDFGDQTRIRRGEAFGELHFWNEHIVPMSPGGADLLWAASMCRKMRRSLIELAAFVQSDPRFATIKGFRGETAFGPDKPLQRARLALGALGFEISQNARPGGFFGWCIRAGEAIYLWGMIRTFNRGAMKDKRLAHPTWIQLRMSRKALLRIYGPNRRGARLGRAKPAKPEARAASGSARNLPPPNGAPCAKELFTASLAPSRCQTPLGK